MTSIVRFLIGSFLLMTGCLLVLSGAITIVGLPIGLMVLAAGMSRCSPRAISKAGES